MLGLNTYLPNKPDSIRPVRFSRQSRRLPMREVQHEPLLDRKSAAKYLGLAPGTLAVWDCTKRYDLKPLKVGRAVRYRRSDLDAFLNSRLMR